MPPKPKKKRKRKTPKVIEYTSCPHCGGSGRTVKVLDDVCVSDALAAIQRLHERYGYRTGGGLEAEVCFRGLDARLPDIELEPGEELSPARDLVISAWELRPGEAMENRVDWNLLELLKNRVAEVPRGVETVTT